jgi:hypothetical protein
VCVCNVYGIKKEKNQKRKTVNSEFAPRLQNIFEISEASCLLQIRFVDDSAEKKWVSCLETGRKREVEKPSLKKTFSVLFLMVLCNEKRRDVVHMDYFVLLGY